MLLSHLFLKPCESHTLGTSRSLSFGALSLSFPTVSVVPPVNYYRLLSLTRLPKASGPFSLRSSSRVRPPRHCQVSVATLFSFCVTTLPCDPGFISSRLFSVSTELCPVEQSYSSPGTHIAMGGSSSPERTSSNLPGLGRFPV